MTISEYTVLRAEALNKLNIPETDLPIRIKTLWLENIDSNDNGNTIYTGTHSHSFFEIHFVFSGKVTYECGSQTVKLCSGQALLLPPHTPHRYIKCGESFFKSSLAFSFDKSDSASILLPEESFERFAFSNHVAENINFILKQSERNDFFSPAIISGRILEIIYSVCSSLQIRLPENHGTDTDSRLSVAKEYIYKNRHRLITCEDVAKECCLSAKQLSRIFKSSTDKTLFDYIISERLKYSKRLLLQSKCSIKEISYMLGFENECSFVSFFKRHCGIPPGLFRKQNLCSDAHQCPDEIKGCPE